MSGPVPELPLRFAARVVADPAGVVGQWRSLTGCKAVGCVPPIPVPEILHAAELLPVPWEGPAIPLALRSRLDAWVVAPDGLRFPEPSEGKCRFEFPTIPPVDLATALDLMESLAEWAGVLSGRPVTEGGLWKSIRAYRERKVLFTLFDRQFGRGHGYSPGRIPGDISRAGDYLPPGAYSLLLAQSLRISCQPTPVSWEEERDDPLIRLARRMIVEPGDEDTSSSPEP